MFNLVLYHIFQMILNEMVEKLSCHLMIADESTNQVIRKKLTLSKWSTASELIDILQLDLANHELADFKLYLATDDKGRRTMLKCGTIN